MDCFVSTTTNSMKYPVNWIPLRTRFVEGLKKLLQALFLDWLMLLLLLRKNYSASLAGSSKCSNLFLSRFVKTQSSARRFGYQAGYHAVKSKFQWRSHDFLQRACQDVWRVRKIWPSEAWKDTAIQGQQRLSRILFASPEKVHKPRFDFSQLHFDIRKIIPTSKYKLSNASARRLLSTKSRLGKHNLTWHFLKNLHRPPLHFDIRNTWPEQIRTYR